MYVCVFVCIFFIVACFITGSNTTHLNVIYTNTIQENELADTLAKEAATNTDIMECYKKVPKSVVIRELGEISV
jgi:hypothetical protein